MNLPCDNIISLSPGHCKKYKAWKATASQQWRCLWEEPESNSAYFCQGGMASAMCLAGGRTLLPISTSHWLCSPRLRSAWGPLTNFLPHPVHCCPRYDQTSSVISGTNQTEHAYVKLSREYVIYHQFLNIIQNKIHSADMSIGRNRDVLCCCQSGLVILCPYTICKRQLKHHTQYKLTHIYSAIGQDKSKQLFLFSSSWQPPLRTRAEATPQHNVTCQMMPTTTHVRTSWQAYCTHKSPASSSL